MCFALNNFATFRNKRVDFGWGVYKATKLAAESLRWLVGLDVDVTSKSLDFCNLFGTLFLLSTHGFEHELVDIGFTQKFNEKLRRSQNLWFHDNNQKPLIIDLPLYQLLRRILALCIKPRQRRNNSLRKLLQEIFSKCMKIVMSPCDLPLEWISHDLHLNQWRVYILHKLRLNNLASTIRIFNLLKLLLDDARNILCAT